MQVKNDIHVIEAIDRLSLPAFYTDDQRMMAYYIIMESGNSIQKVIAEKGDRAISFRGILCGERAGNIKDFVLSHHIKKPPEIRDNL